MQFFTTLQGIDVTLLNVKEAFVIETDYHEIEGAEFRVRWGVEIESRDWGIKGLSSRLYDITGHFTIAEFDEKGDEIKSQDVNFTLDGFKTEMNLEFDEYRQLSPTDITVDFKAKTVEVV